MPSILSELEPLKVWLKYIGPKMVCQKSWIFLCHVVAFCSELEYITLFETQSILSELETLKVRLKYIGLKMVRRKSWIFLFHVVAFCSQIQII